MKNLYLIGVAGTFMAQACLSLAEQPLPEASPAAATVFSEPTQVRFGGKNPDLNQQASAGVNITRSWEQRSYAAMSQQPGPDGSVQFRFGESLPTVVCAVLELVDIELQAGEVVNQVHLGDTERWKVDAAVSGNADGTQTQHLIVKPADIGLSTNLVVCTDRRTYHLALLSHERELMHHVSFLYRDAPPAPAVAQKPDPAAPAVKVAYEQEASPVPRKSRAQLEGKGTVRQKRSADDQTTEDDGYRISGKAPWRPGRVYNNGRQTFIEMPPKVSSGEAPALFVVRKGGFLGLGSQKNLVNYRVHGRWWVADSVIDKAVLVAGVGGNQDKVTISRATK
jgi:type IV secretory pathway VirB9-like protein